MSRLFNAAFLKAPGALVAVAVAVSGAIVHADASTTSLNWVQVNSTQAPPGRQLAAMSFDSRRGVTVLFGGSDAQIGSTGPQPPNFSDTWEWDGATWSQKTGA